MTGGLSTGALAKFARANLPALTLVVAMAAVASAAGHDELLFPELGALAAGVLIHRLAPWRTRTLDIFLLPVAAALIGYGVNMTGFPAEVRWVLALGSILLLMRVSSSSMVPSISAALLPVLFDFTSLLYPAAVAGTTAVLAVLAVRHNRVAGTPPRLPQPSTRLLVTYWLLGSAWGVAAFALGIQYAAAPPILVAGLELMKTRGAQATPKAIVLVLSVAVGVVTHLAISNWALDVAVAFLAVSLLCRFWKVVIPPAYALAILPLLIATPQLTRFLVTAAIGSLGFVAATWLWTRSGAARAPAPAPTPVPAAAERQRVAA
jgi:hypothetical protein